MTAAQAIKTGLVKSFTFSGRATRSEFWWFAPIAILPPIVAATQMKWDTIEFFGVWRVGVLILFAIPLLSAGHRRLQDAGEDGYQIVLPFMPLIILWFTYQMLLAFSLATLFFSLGVIVGFIALILLIPAYIGAILLSFMLIGPTIGVLILPSQPGDNAFGSNPNEVPS